MNGILSLSLQGINGILFHFSPPISSLILINGFWLIYNLLFCHCHKFFTSIHLIYIHICTK